MRLVFNTIHNVKKTLENAIVPQKGNDYKPHLLRRTGVLVVAIISVAVFTFGFLQRTLLFTDKMLATIYPTLVATLSNKNREEASLPDLKYSPLLEEAARLKAEDMKIRGYFAHVSPDGIDPWHWIKLAGYNYEYAGENLAINFSDSADVTKAWMESPGHRANILSNHFTEVGISTVKGYVNGRETVFVVQMFGSPSPYAMNIASASTTIASTTLSIKNASSTVGTVSSSSPLSLGATNVLGIATTSRDLDESIQNASVFTALSILVSNPRVIVLSLLWSLALAVAMSIIFMIIFFKKHHVPHILYGILLILWIVVCALLYVHYFGPEVLLG